MNINNVQKIAIIGSNSFLAKHLIKKFSNQKLYLFNRTPGSNIDAPFVTEIEFNYPLVPLELEQLLSFDLIIYTAAAGVQAKNSSSSLTGYQMNLYLPLQIVTFLNDKKYKGKLITFGSYFEIGNNNESRSFDENEVLFAKGAIPNSYCDSKRLLTRYYGNRQFEISWFHLIIPSLYGPGEDPNRLIPYVVDRLKNGLDLQLSAGEQIRQYLFVTDLTALIALINESALPADIYNVSGPDSPIKIKDLVSIIYKIMDVIQKPNTSQIDTRDQAMAYLSLSDEKIKSAISAWSPQVSLVEGINQYL